MSAATQLLIDVALRYFQKLDAWNASAEDGGGSGRAEGELNRAERVLRELVGAPPLPQTKVVDKHGDHEFVLESLGSRAYICKRCRTRYEFINTSMRPEDCPRYWRLMHGSYEFIGHVAPRCVSAERHPAAMRNADIRHELFEQSGLEDTPEREAHHHAVYNEMVSRVRASYPDTTDAQIESCFMSLDPEYRRCSTVKKEGT